MENKVLKVFETNDETGNFITMVISFDNEFFGWQIDKYFWSYYWGTDNKPVNIENCNIFANDDENVNIGYSEGMFDTELEVLQAFDLLDGKEN